MRLFKLWPIASGGHRATRFSLALSLLWATSACTSSPPLVSHTVTSSTPAASAVVSSETQTLTPAERNLTGVGDADQAYRLGPNDSIAITVYMHPELSVPQLGVTNGTGGVVVTSDGTVGLPLLGNVELGGLTLAQAQQKLTDLYAVDINQPNVTIQLVTAQSLKYYLFGAFTDPGVKYPGHMLTLLEALSLGGSLDAANADLYQAYVAQGSNKMPVDLHALLVGGDLTQNILLASGDTIVVPPASDEDAFVLGAVGKPGAVPFQGGSLSLVQALSVADMDLANYSSARLEQVRVIRAQGDHAEFDIVDAEKILRGEALPFQLEPGDIVFVPPTTIASWNAVLNMILPSLTTISGILNPFVQIKFLSQPNH
jgi:polysaccharide export outer membrane protein